MRSERKIGEVKAKLDNTPRRIFAFRMILERAFPRRMEKTCLTRATLNSFPRQTLPHRLLLALKVVLRSSIFAGNVVSSSAHCDACRVRCCQVSGLSRVSYR